MKRMMKQALVLSLSFLAVCGISVSAKTAVGCAGKSTSYGTVSCISYDRNGWSHTTKYVFGGSNITGQVWVRDANGNERTESATRTGSNASSQTEIRANILSSLKAHYHFYENYKNSV